MPYKVRYVKGDERPFKIVRIEDNQVVGSSKNAKDAYASIAHREKSEK